MGKVIKQDQQFDARIKLPVDQGTPANRDIWFDSASGKLGFHIGGVDALVPLASEIAGGGLTEEQIEDFIALLIQDNSILDWTYTDATPSLVAIIKAGVVTNTELANMAQSTIKGRTAGAGTGAPVDLTVAQVKTILALASTDLSDFTTAARAAISISDTSTLDLSYASGVLSGVVLDSPTLGGDTKAAIKADIISSIVAGASAAYDTLVEIQALLAADDTALSGLTTAVAARSRFFAGTLANGSPTATVTHNLGLSNIHDFTHKIFVSSTGAVEEYAIVGATSNTATVTDETGANIASGRRIFLTAGV